MQPNTLGCDQELLALAAATRQVAGSMAEPTTRTRLLEIADELVELAKRQDCSAS